MTKSDQTFETVGVIGGGAWGTALAQTAALAGQDVTLWAFEPDCVDAINSSRQNTLFLSGITLDERITATSDMSQLAGCDVILAVAPAQHMRATLLKFAPHAREGLPVILCSKGIENESLKFMADVLADTLPRAVCGVLAGPSFAAEVARGLPAAVTLACKDIELGRALAQTLAAPNFRPYLSSDIVGAEIGGAVKNVLAIACGLVLGRQLGKSAHAAIIARGFREMTRLGEALGAKPETLTGLCGLGDLVLTCSSEQSRNMSCGLALGQGQSLEDIMSSRSAVTEGVATAPALKTLSENLGVDMPICSAIAHILDGHINVDQAIAQLLGRDLKPEME